MAKKSRMGSDPLIRSTGKKNANKEDQTEKTSGIDSLIKDTRGTAKPDNKTKSSLKPRVKAKAKPAKTEAKAPSKAKSAKKAKAKTTSKKPVKSKIIKKAVPEAKKPVVREPSAEIKFEPGTVIDLDAPLEEQVALAKPATKKPATKKPEAASVASAPEEEVVEMAIHQKEPVKVSEEVEDDYFEQAKGSEPEQLYKEYVDQDDADQFLGFSLGQEYFAFEIGSVREVLTFTTVTSVPQTPEFMSGVINLRGNVVPVVDLRLLFGLEKGEETVDTCIIIVEVEFEDEIIEIGATADAVREVFDLKEEDIEPAPKIGTHLNTDFIKGMGRKDDEFTLILDLKEVFSARNLWGI